MIREKKEDDDDNDDDDNDDEYNFKLQLSPEEGFQTMISSQICDVVGRGTGYFL